MFNTTGSKNTSLLIRSSLNKNKELNILRKMNKDLIEALKTKCSLHPNQCPKSCLCKYCRPHKLLIEIEDNNIDNA